MQLAGGEPSVAADDDRLPDHTALSGRRVGVTLHHEPLRFRPDRVSAELSPRDEELLIGREAVNEF